MKASERGVAAALGLAALGLYAYTLAPSLGYGDQAELQYMPYILGVSHPTGYPLYMLLGWLWSHALPVGTVAYRMNLFSAVCGAAAVVGLYAVVRQLTDDGWAAVLAGACLAVTPIFWSQAVVAEVYALNALFVTAMFYGLLRWASVRQRTGGTEFGRRSTQKTRIGGIISANQRLSASSSVALIYGLSLTHHRTMLLLALPFALFVISVRGKTLLHRRRRWLALAALVALPQLLYLYVPIRALQLYRGVLPPWQLVIESVRRVILGSQFAPDIGWRAGSVGRMAGLLWAQLGWWGLGLGVLGLYALARRREWPALALLGGSGLVIILFGLVYDVGDVAVMVIPTFVAWAALVGLGVALLRRAVGQWRLAPTAVGLAVAVAIGGTMVAHWGAVSRRGDYAVERQARAVFDLPLQRDSVILSGWETATPLEYLQLIEGVRRDVRVMRGTAAADIAQVRVWTRDEGRAVYVQQPVAELNFLGPEYTLRAMSDEVTEIRWGQ